MGFEALSRFPAEWGIAPDVAFEQAHSVGFGARMELLAIQRAAETLDSVDGYVSRKITPAVLVDPDNLRLLGELPLDRIVLELSEHDQVADYTILAAALEPLRSSGMRLSIDDVGAGFSSLRHIVLTSPDVIKLDRSFVDGVSGDRILTTLVRALVQFAHDCDAVTVAEGIETEADGQALLDLGVEYGQGWHYGRPAPAASFR